MTQMQPPGQQQHQPQRHQGQQGQQHQQGQHGQQGQQLPGRQQGQQRQQSQQGRQGQQGQRGQQALQGSQQAGVQANRVGQLFPTWNYLPEETRRRNVAVLNQCLADLVVVHGQLKTAHWNVKGPTFAQLHELFDEIATTLEPHVDEVAERVTALGGLARGSVREAARETAIPQLPPELVAGEAFLEELAHNLSILDAELFRQMEAAEQQRDLDTVDLLNEVSRDVSKALWFVEAHLQGPAAGPGGIPQGGSAGGQIGPQQTLSQYQDQ